MLEGDNPMMDVLYDRQAELISDFQEMRLVIREGVPEKPAPDPTSEMWLQIGTSVAKVLGRSTRTKLATSSSAF